MFYLIPFIALLVLPAKYAERIINSKVESFIEKRTFPDKLLDILSNNPEIITPNMYDAISKMYVLAQDGQIKRVEPLILEVNSEKLYCHHIPNLNLSNREISTDYAGQKIAEAIGQPWQCKDL